MVNASAATESLLKHIKPLWVFPALISKATSWDGSLDYNDWNIKQDEALPFSFDNDSDEVRGDYGGFRLREL